MVPQRLRADWRQEWAAELDHRERMLADWDHLDRRNKFDLLRRSTSAFWDALWLQPQRLEEEMFQDVRFGIRMLLKHRGFTLIAILTIALGIGANLTIFSFVDTMFYRPLPVPEPYQLVNLGDADMRGFAYPLYAHLRDHSKAFTSLAAHYSTAPLNVSGDGDSEMMNGAVVSANYFPTLQIKPVLGRFFSPEEDAVPDRDRVVVISHRLWQTRYSGDPSVVGKKMRLNSTDFTIIGVTPEKFEGVSPGYPNELWIPTMMLRLGYRWCDALQNHDCGPLLSIGRLAPDHNATKAQVELAMLSSQLAAANPEIKDRGIRVDEALGVRGMDRPSLSYQLKLMMAMTGLLLLVACANVAGLLLTAAASRRKEIAVRLSIGAGRVRLIRQFLTESFLLTLGGGFLGFLFSLWAKNLLLVFYTTNSSNFRQTYDLSLNPRTVMFAFVITLVTGILFGIIPAIQSTKQNLVSVLKDEGSSQSTRHTWSRSGLVIGQVALSLALLVSAGLLVRSAARVRRGVNFDPEHVAVVRLRPRLSDYPPEKAQSFTRDVVSGLKAIPGVESVSLSSGFTLNSSGDARVRLPEQVFARVEDQPEVDFHEIAPHFFDTLKIPFVQGRDFNDGDRVGAPRVAIVNETLARAMWQASSPLERLLVVNDQPYRIIGVAKDAQLRNNSEEPKPFFYLPYWQNNLRPQVDSYLVIRVTGDPEAMLPLFRRKVNDIDAKVPLDDTVALTHQLAGYVKPMLLTGGVLVASSLVALFLSIIGLYGALSFAVSQRTREIGMRMALGAEAVDVLKLVLGQGLRLVLIGVILGLVLAYAATRVLQSLLYGVSATDPTTFGVISVLVMIVTLIACWIPARRATKVDPLTALRHE